MALRVARPDTAPGATIWYALLACAMTWPVAAHIGTGVPQDLGDPLLNIWILGWDVSHFARVLGGEWKALSGFWNGNIFYPHPLTLAYSEHLLAQAVEVLPIYILTRNLILCYNLLLLSTFVLSGLGAFLLVRELTGNGRAAFVAGLLYAFALVRAQHLGHMQVLSSQWMPFVLFGLRRYIVTRRWPGLAGATAAMVAQNLSCGYYLVFFTPFVVAYVVYEMWMRRAQFDGRVWRSLVLAGLAVAVATVPFFLPYVELRSYGLGRRDGSDVDQFSADVYSYVTACPNLRVWGHVLSTFPKLEAGLFVGFVPLALGVVGVTATGRRAWRAATESAAAIHGHATRNRSLERVLCLAAILAASAGLVLALAGRDVWWLDTVGPAAGRPGTYFFLSSIACVALLVWSARVRALLRPRADHSSAGFYLVAAAAAVWLSFGRYVRSGGYLISGPTLYDWLYRHVPGFDGLRVPSRYGMLAALFLAVLAGFGADAISRQGRRGRAALVVLAVAFLVEAAFAPLPVHGIWSRRKATLQPAMAPGAEQVYERVARLPQSAVLIELPINDDRFSDNLYLYASTMHWRRLVNGTSGWIPPAYSQLAASLARPWEHGEQAWQPLITTGATHAVVHEALFAGNEGSAVTQWLRLRGAREVFAVGTHHVFELPGRSLSLPR